MCLPRIGQDVEARLGHDLLNPVHRLSRNVTQLAPQEVDRGCDLVQLRRDLGGGRGPAESRASAGVTPPR